MERRSSLIFSFKKMTSTWFLDWVCVEMCFSSDWGLQVKLLMHMCGLRSNKNTKKKDNKLISRPWGFQNPFPEIVNFHSVFRWSCVHGVGFRVCYWLGPQNSFLAMPGVVLTPNTYVGKFSLVHNFISPVSHWLCLTKETALYSWCLDLKWLYKKPFVNEMVGRTGKLYVNTFNDSTILKYSLEYLLLEGIGLLHEYIQT